MELYTAVLFVHVATAMALGAAVGILAVCEALLREANSLDRMRSLARVIENTGKWMMPMALVILGAGLYMTHARWAFSAPWVIASLIVFVYLAVTGKVVSGGRTRATIAAAEQARAITPEIRQRLRDPVLARISAIRIALFALIAFMMTTKPALPGVLVAAALALTTAVIAAELRRPRASGTRTTKHVVQR